jgi:hypothetical protein
MTTTTTTSPYAVALAPVLDLVEEKLKADIQALQAIVGKSDGLRDFAEQTRLLTAIQAGVRSLDVLTGQATLNGDSVDPGKNAPKPANPHEGTVAFNVPQPQQAQNPPPQMGTVDLEALSKALADEAKQSTQGAA